MATGTPRETCEAQWDAAHAANPSVPPGSTAGPRTGASPSGDVYAQLNRALKEINMLKGRLELREDQLKQAIEIARQADREVEARESAEHEMLADSIVLDCPTFVKDDLMKKTIDELRTMRTTLDKSQARTFATVTAEIDARERRKAPLLTAGHWNAKTNRWEGGV